MRFTDGSACRAADSVEGSIYSDYRGHWWDPKISPVATTV